MTFPSLLYPRTRDCVALYKGDAFPVALSSSLLASGWQGGQGVMWADSTKDEFQVTRSDGRYGGFLLWGSNEESDQYTGVEDSQLTYGYATFCAGGWLIATRTYEQYTWQSRQVAPLVQNAYVVGERVRFSLRGLWTRQDEWTLSGDPRGANPFLVGSVVQAPSADNSYYLTIQTSI